MLSPAGIIEAASAMAASFPRCLKMKYSAMIEKNTNETAVMTSMGRSASHADTGISFKALHAVQRASITPQVPFKARAARAANSAPPARIRPMTPTAIAHAARSDWEVLSQAMAAQSANALHILIE